MPGVRPRRPRPRLDITIQEISHATHAACPRPRSIHPHARVRHPLTPSIRVDTLIAMSDPVDLSVCRDCHCLAARRNAREITRLFEEELRPHGLRATQFSVLAALALRGPTPVGELAEALGVERTTLTRSAAVLERNGWVGRARAEDARERPLRLSRAGRRKVEEAFPAWKKAQEAVEAKLRDGALAPMPRSQSK